MQRLAITLLSFFLLTGCKEEVLYSGLSEKEANAMVAVLLSYELAASKNTSKNNEYSVLTTKEDFPAAFQLLKFNGYPRPSFTRVPDIFKESQIVSSKLALRARYLYAMSEQIASSVTLIGGVVDAQVILSLPEHDPLAENQIESSASVVIQHRADIDLRPHVGKIKAVVVNGVENLPYENVTVELFPELPIATPSTIVKPTQVSVDDSSVRTSIATALPVKLASIDLGPVFFVITGLGLLCLVLGVAVGPKLLVRSHRKQE
ncbi:MAG: type III secretion inner membrane ring lipoprotein SctJ [Granulosicoccus sp.]|nr:type III secretion inner membrane ring lipoprotein SctJ [Granulosicoccus sp.]